VTNQHSSLNRAKLALLIAALLFALSSILERSILFAFPPFSLLFWQFLLAFIVAFNLFIHRLVSVPRSTIIMGVVCGVFLFVGLACRIMGGLTISPERSAFLVGLCVLFVPYFLWLTLSQPLRFGVVAPAALAAIGLILLHYPHPQLWQRGDIYSLVSALGFAGHFVALQEANRRADFRHLIVIQFFVVAFLTGVFAVWREPLLLPEYPISIAATSMIAVLGGYGLQTWAQRHLPAGESAIFLTTKPVLATLIILLLTGVKSDMMTTLGAGLIVAAVVFTNMAISLRKEAEEI
jgi:drug/metabolite transporter (DMT)-like permease